MINKGDNNEFDEVKFKLIIWILLLANDTKILL